MNISVNQQGSPTILGAERNLLPPPFDFSSPSIFPASDLVSDTAVLGTAGFKGLSVLLGSNGTGGLILALAVNAEGAVYPGRW